MQRCFCTDDDAKMTMQRWLCKNEYENMTMQRRLRKDDNEHIERRSGVIWVTSVILIVNHARGWPISTFYIRIKWLLYWSNTLAAFVDISLWFSKKKNLKNQIDFKNSPDLGFYLHSRNLTKRMKKQIRMSTTTFDRKTDRISMFHNLLHDKLRYQNMNIINRRLILIIMWKIEYNFL